MLTKYRNIFQVSKHFEIAHAAQAIPPILRSVVGRSVCLSVCLSVCPCLNRSTNLDAIWHAHMWVQWHIVLDGYPWHPSGSQKHAIANCSQNGSPMIHLVNTNEELGGLTTAIPYFDKLFWLLFISLV